MNYREYNQHASVLQICPSCMHGNANSHNGDHESGSHSIMHTTTLCVATSVDIVYTATGTEIHIH